MNRLHCVLLAAGLLLSAASPAWAAGEAERWGELFAAVPALPASPAVAATMISGQIVQSEMLGIAQLRIDVADTGLKRLQHDVDALFKPTAQASAVQFRRLIDTANNDPAVIELARKIEKIWQLDPANPGKLPTPDELRALDRELERELGPLPSPASAPPLPRSEIAAYRLELRAASPRAAEFVQRLATQRRQRAQQHAQADRESITQMAGADASAVAHALVARHEALARQQLADAAVLLHVAREALAPRVARLVELVRAAEQRNAAPVERNEAYVLLKSYIELLLTLLRDTVQDVGFWGGIRVSLPAAQAGTASLYEHERAPGFDLRANGEQPYSLPHYPLGRAIVVGLPPGIR